MRENMIKCSIVIPTYQHLQDALIPCLNSIFKYTDLSQMEILIVANGCTDGTKEYVEGLIAQGKPIRLFNYSEPLGFSKAVNIGLSEAKGEYLLILNNDTEFQATNWFELLKQPFINDSSVGLVGPIQHTEVGFEFLIFFCVLINRITFNKVGLLIKTQ